jgi:hypothetical protein
MRPLHWIAVIVLVLTAAVAWRFGLAARSAPAVATLPGSGTSVSRIMSDAIDPASTVVFKAVSTTISSAGVEERAPKTDDEWQSVEANARILAEAAKLMIASPRHHGDREWIVLSTALVDAATIAETAARRRDASGVFAAGEGIYATCDGCHRKYLLPMRMPLPFP